MNSLRMNRSRLSLVSKILFIVFVFSCGGILFGHSGKASFHILIDTDAAPDDLRAICLFLASQEFEILAITVSDGALTPEEGLVKVRALLTAFGHDGIPTGRGRSVQQKEPSWRGFCQSVKWGKEESIRTRNEINAADLIVSAVESEDEPVIGICLGSLTNIADAFKAKPQMKSGISRIVWYNDSALPLAGTNYETDREAALSVVFSGIPLEVVSNSGKNACVFDALVLKSIRSVRSPYAQKISETHSQKPVLRKMASGHLKLWDDLLPVYLLYPDMFSIQTVKKPGNLKLLTAGNAEEITAKFLEILQSRDIVKSKVFKGFPDLPELFAEDVRPSMNSIIREYGMEEWRVGVLTNELHGHLGIYSIIGAKMGLRARQYFNIGIDDISVVSYAGSTPPLSCMNDGLQVSTGGTVGHGLFAVSSEPDFRPEAAFTFKGRTLRIRLKDRYWERVNEDIRRGIELFGSGTEENWNYVRKLAIRYWLEWDRNDIFILKEVKETPPLNPDSSSEVSVPLSCLRDNIDFYKKLLGVDTLGNY